MFAIDGVKALEIVARVCIIYVACLVLLRVAGRRQVSELSQMDLLAMLLISETVSPALTGNDESITVGVLAAATLFALCVATGWLAFRSSRVERLLQGTAVVLIEDGRVHTEVLRRHRISDDDLKATLHQNGVLHVGEVKRAYIEPDGQITLIKRADHEEAQPFLQGGRDRERGRDRPGAEH